MKTRLIKIIKNRIFRIVVLCGGAGVALDIDHPIHFYIIPELDGRFLHTPALYFFSSIIACLLLYAALIYFKLYVRKLSLRNLPDVKFNLRLGQRQFIINGVINSIAGLIKLSIANFITFHKQQLSRHLSRYNRLGRRLALFCRKSLPRTTNFWQRQFSPKKL